MDESIPIIEQRRIEANLIKALLPALEGELGAEKARELLTAVIVELAREKGAELRVVNNNDSLITFAETWEPWLRGGTLDMEVVTLTDDEYRFNVTRCAYAEMYRELGLAELGFILSCNRDAALVEGFSDRIEFRRTQTIMEGAPYCDFHYFRRKKEQHAGGTD